MKDMLMIKSRDRRCVPMPANIIARKLKMLKQKGSIHAVDVANVMRVWPETVSRWNHGKAFPHPEAERTLLDLEYVIDQLAELYEPDEARLWLFARHKLLGGNVPAELIGQHRTKEVFRLLRKLPEAGVSHQADVPIRHGGRKP